LRKACKFLRVKICKSRAKKEINRG